MPLLSSTLPDYHYSPLDPSRRLFRLVKLLPPKPPRIPGTHGTLRIELVEVGVDSGALYDALSYVWGDASRREGTVTVETAGDSRRLSIHRPLELALRHLAANDAVKLPLFVDQISINQDDGPEKSRQVQLMRDIYARCSRTVVWLGPATRASGRYFDLVRDLCSQGVLGRVMGPRVGGFMAVFDAVMDPDLDVDGEQREDRDDILDLLGRFGARFPLDGFANVLDRGWFNRLWTIQEACLAPAVVFVCGRQLLCFDCFRAGALFYNIYSTHWARHRTGTTSQHDIRRRSAMFNKTAGLRRIFQERRAIHQTGRRQGLYGLVLKFNVNHDDAKIGSSLAEDRVFGLLGLAADDDGLRRRVRVRYAGDAVRVYAEVAALLVEESVDVLLFSQFPKQTRGLPSWVPDWAMDLTVPVGYSSLTDAVFAAGGPNKGGLCCLDESGRRLTVRGVLVDRVVVVGQRTHRRSPERRLMDETDDRWAKLFFDETAEFVAASGRDSPGHMALRLCDSGLSYKHFSHKLGASAGPERLGALHGSVSLLGQRLLDSDETAASYHITRIYRTLGITPWYWIPASDMTSLRLCARDPAAAASLLLLAVVDFLADMLGLCAAAARVAWATRRIRLRRRFGRVRLHPAPEAVTALGLDPAVSFGPDMALLSTNMLKNAGRRLYRTERGHVGVGPAHTEPGDAVVVIRGGTVPHLLRGGGGGEWKYLGEAYCDGIMDGEALEGVCDETSFILA
ncbi:hypothetical protein G6O67_006292 [Ophiocordyceps sinensis]|uniref:Heterokaryon incompatibility domain-containing protein n=1 Tax=Ophiocordyceps sinensis TaxID=72228 RepID=A0A8H4PMK7_9HYPO|nr:hypothetical protein G6O67_006292 [Ophiocordyceps sinensis]